VTDTSKQNSFFQAIKDLESTLLKNSNKEKICYGTPQHNFDTIIKPTFCASELIHNCVSVLLATWQYLHLPLTFEVQQSILVHYPDICKVDENNGLSCFEQAVLSNDKRTKGIVRALSLAKVGKERSLSEVIKNQEQYGNVLTQYYYWSVEQNGKRQLRGHAGVIIDSEKVIDNGQDVIKFKLFGSHKSTDGLGIIAINPAQMERMYFGLFER
jgi:hypothetical protein